MSLIFFSNLKDLYETTLNLLILLIGNQWHSHWGAGGQSATPDSEKNANNWRGKKPGKIGEKEEKSGRKGKNREGSFTLPILTDRAGYATVEN